MAISKIKVGSTVHELQTKVANITDLTATATELNHMDGVTSNVQTQLNNKLSKSDIIPAALERTEFIDFTSSAFVHIDDSVNAVENGGTYYDASGQEAMPSNGRWEKSISGSDSVEEGVWLAVDGSTDTTGAKDHRYVGHFPQYSLANNTYTLEFDYIRNYDKRHKFYFANGTFIDPNTGGPIPNGGCDTIMPCLGFELNYADGMIDYKLYRQSTGFVNDTNIFNRKTVAFPYSSLFSEKIKVVLNGGAQKYVTLYDETGTTYNYNVRWWQGYIVPITFTIYHVVNGKDMKVAEGTIYQPSSIGLVFGIGDYDVLSSGKYYGAKNLRIYKGDTAKSVAPFYTYGTTELISKQSDLQTGTLYFQYE